jgi:hypothetical protein
MTDRPPDPRRLEAHRLELTWRLRLAFIAGAEERSRETVGRGLADEEIERVLRRYPGDLPGR